ncbi:MAG: hypothetical protein PF517_02330 [Salinivirgaceae bacterium]|jgi:hypothetical protein|nr:hypothetical protein [Salinivirgaceae bacterium]
MACKIIWQNNGVHLKYSGIVTLNDVLQVGNIQLSSRKYDNCIYEISDFSEVKDSNISEQDIKVIGTWDITANNFVHLKYAIVILTKSESFSLAEMYLNMMQKINMETARVDNYDEAVKFLLSKKVDV